MENENDIGGIIYPTMSHNLNLLKKRKAPVYVKFITHGKTKNPTKLRSGHILLLYLSKGNKLITDYGKIKDVSFKSPSDIRQNHLDKIQMMEKDFDVYIGERISKPLIFLELDRISELKNPVKVNYPITMAGRYVSIEEAKEIIIKGMESL